MAGLVATSLGSLECPDSFQHLRATFIFHIPSPSSFISDKLSQSAFEICYLYVHYERNMWEITNVEGDTQCRSPIYFCEAMFWSRPFLDWRYESCVRMMEDWAQTVTDIDALGLRQQKNKWNNFKSAWIVLNSCEGESSSWAHWPVIKSWLSCV